jgi:hypothetical protein
VSSRRRCRFSANKQRPASSIKCPLDGELEHAAELLLLGLCVDMGDVVGLLHRFEGRKQGPLFRRLLLQVKRVIEEGEVVLLLCLDLLHRLPILVSSEFPVQSRELQVLLLVIVVLEVEVGVLLGDVGQGRWRQRRWWRRLDTAGNRVGGYEASRHDVEAEGRTSAAVMAISRECGLL